jgi:O-antigen/teichoic acid export membrane protein
MAEQRLDADPTDGRDETATERMDRNWNELLQELRVAQTGVQILTGFLLTVPFQQRFADLDRFQERVYLVLVVLAVAATGFIVAPVSLHRLLFRRHLKRELVTSADRMARTGLAMLALVLAGSALLLFDVVVGRTAGWVAGGLVLAGLALVWVVVPVRLARRARHESAA